MTEPQPKTSSRPIAQLQVGTIELAAGGEYRVRLLHGELVTATAGPGCDPALMTECLRDRRTVLLTSTADGPVVIGALQTRPSPTSSRDDMTEVDGRRIELNADDAITMRAGKATLELRGDGTLRLCGQRLTIDVATLVKVLSGRVELP